MNPSIHADITRRLLNDFEFKPENGWLRKGRCPNCAERELYTHEAEPWVLRCGRLDRCGYEEHIKSVYPDAFEAWTERYPSTPADPYAAAKAYLTEARGFPVEKLEGWFTQEHYWNPERNIGSSTVRFALPGIGYWERIIDRPERFGKRKATFRGEYGGTWWQPPHGFNPAAVGELWIVEGVFDAIALLLNGVAAVSTLTCNNFPALALKAVAEQIGEAGRRPRLVFAYDGDNAGRRYTRKHVAEAIRAGWDATAAQIPQSGGKKRDWNDLHQLGKLTARDLDDYRYHGALLIAPTPAAKANLVYSHHGWNTFSFDHDNRLYWFKLDLEAYDRNAEIIENENPDFTPEEIRERALMRSNSVTEICNCLPASLYYMRNDVTDEAWYYFRIDFPHDGASLKNTFTAGQLTASAEFKKRLLHIAPGALWTGTAAQMDRMLRQWTYGIKTVKTVDFIGYELQDDAYIYNSVAVIQGRVVALNAEDYFEYGKLSIKSLSRALKLDISPDSRDQADWFERFVFCFGPKGVVALAFWFGSLFAEQIRRRFESWPFIEIVGEPGSGKSTLLEFLWRLVGRNAYEGFDPMKGSFVGHLRTMAQVANLPVVLIESDRDSGDDEGRGRPRSVFDWDALKSAYNGGTLRTTGVKSSGNDTYEPQFRGALVISQNVPIQASQAFMERLVHVFYDKSHQSEAGRDAALELGRLTARQVSHFLIKATSQAADVLAAMDASLRNYERTLRDLGSKNQRIQKNHSQPMVMVDCLSLVCPITDTQKQQARDLIGQMALDREKALARNHPMVENFWEAFEYLDGAPEEEGGLPVLNHARDPGLIAVNLNHFAQVAAEKRQQIPPLTELKRHLRTSKRPKFVEVRTVNSAINAIWNLRVDNPAAKRPSSVKCWVFQTAGSGGAQ